MKAFILLVIAMLININLQAENKICLNMIVKNEAHVIERCLDSVKDLIDYWVIFDTGSTDGTQEVIKKYLKDIPGDLYQSTWVNFGHNRNEALQLAKGKGSYIMFIDADEILHVPKDFNKNDLNKDCYYATVTGNQKTCTRIFLINPDRQWTWEGVLHEKLCCAQSINYQILNEVQIEAIQDGNRSKDPQKYEKDVLVLENELKKDPNNSRYMYYLGQSYLNAKNYKKSLEAFEKRTLMKGCLQELFFSYYQSAFIKYILNYSDEEIMKSLNDAHAIKPNRAEPLFYICNLLIKQKCEAIAYLIAKQAKQIPLPNERGPKDNWIYDYGIDLVLFNCCANLEKYQEANDIWESNLKNYSLPREEKQKTISLLSFVKMKLMELSSR